jgi:hypothetical protein
MARFFRLLRKASCSLLRAQSLPTSPFESISSKKFALRAIQRGAPSKRSYIKDRPVVWDV